MPVTLQSGTGISCPTLQSESQTKITSHKCEEIEES